MDREKILLDVEEALKFVLCRKGTPENKAFLSRAIERFVSDEVRAYPDQVLQDTFVAPEGEAALENGVRLFRGYLEQLRDQVLSGANPEGEPEE